ncbi:hypothetical protein BI362_06680 [Streptococcus parauberis]|uniref:Uncharacterized protein n=2 Tax=Streptococcus parauberis TaxID=1348 RepID=A0AAE4KZH7_9STRE|nr:hypothetical protein [Streptococcus parauberis]AUT05527.1 hypothetical protein SPSF3K_00801 [Streptococcus parauberis]EMF49319.1 hypothetical protein SPJ2_0139 [Streptococcus parauberis KRS-02109]EMG26450.1 hypothetical protein SPJ1_0412 [Streptococcus parauberis KRS-02083]KYP17550.1 hypothetical protein TN39_01760 [Streptococcus parauberis]KYP18794.1 hypothetical protein AKL14_01081 [Streptococcus parauberis]
MKKCQISMLVLIISLFTSSISVFAGARQIEQLSNFRITPSYTATGYLQKMNDSYYVVNLDAKNPQIKVKHYLANSNGAKRSDIDMIWTGQRGIYTNDAKRNHIYNLNLARENFWDGGFFIDGSWSPDSK